ncbi:MAG: hypothetical protein ACOY3X_13745 [Pseudomonadota bacterium]
MFLRNLVFRLVLWGLGLRLGWLSRHNEGFQGKIRGQDFVLQFGTFDNAVVRHYVFANGLVSSHSGAHEKPASAITFVNSKVAMDTLMKAAKDQTVFMKAMGEGKVKIAGSDMTKLMVFMSIAKYIGPQKKKRS